MGKLALQKRDDRVMGYVQIASEMLVAREPTVCGLGLAAVAGRMARPGGRG